MKWLFIGLGAVFAAVIVGGGIAALCRKHPEKSNDDIDGGVVKRYWTDAPKTGEDLISVRHTDRGNEETDCYEAEKQF